MPLGRLELAWQQKGFSSLKKPKALGLCSYLVIIAMYISEM